MPRRRPPGAGPGLSTTLFALLFVFPLIATAAQQQQPPPHSGYRRSPREDALVDTITPQRHSKVEQDRLGNSAKRSRHTPIISQNERAIATLPSAPAVSNAAVRAPPAGSAASPSGGLSSRPRARSLQDWEVEDFVLLATVDGHIHARDRSTGKEIWDLDAGRPMVETIYHQKNESDDKNPQDKAFMWIVEPIEDGNLYVLTPGPYPVLQNLGLTIKQLAEELSPYSSTDPPVVYTAEKKNVMYVLDARTGTVLKRFSSGGSAVVNAESCEPQVTGFESTKQRECKGIFNLGQTEYIISIQNEVTGENICTIKYFEWTPNNRDRDLHGQYLSTMDNKYVYSKYDGTIFALDHTLHRKIYPQRPVYTRKFSSPVVRVFDVARPFDDDTSEPALIILPQPAGPAASEDGVQDVWVNCTETGSWYAMSESSYPAVTDGAARALCYSPEWSREMLAWGGTHYLPDKTGLIGVHSLSHDDERRADVPTISAPVDDPQPIDETEKETSQDTLYHAIAPKSKNAWWPLFLAIMALTLGLGSYGYAKPTAFGFGKKTLARVETPLVTVPSMEAEPPAVEDKTPPEANKRTVRFVIPEDEQDGDALSRTSTLDQLPIDMNGSASEGLGQQATEEEGEAVLDPANSSETPKPKKKAHRGQRGGRKKKKATKEEEEVNRAVEAAKQLDPEHPLQPDEVTISGEGMQDVSNIKKYVYHLCASHSRYFKNCSLSVATVSGPEKI